MRADGRNRARLVLLAAAALLAAGGCVRRVPDFSAEVMTVVLGDGDGAAGSGLPRSLAGKGMAVGSLRGVAAGRSWEGTARGGVEVHLYVRPLPKGKRMRHELISRWYYWLLPPGRYQIEKVALKTQRKGMRKIQVLARRKRAAEADRESLRPVEGRFCFDVRAGESAFLGELVLDIDHGFFALRTGLPAGFAAAFEAEYGRLDWPVRPSPLKAVAIGSKRPEAATVTGVVIPAGSVAPEISPTPVPIGRPSFGGSRPAPSATPALAAPGTPAPEATGTPAPEATGTPAPWEITTSEPAVEPFPPLDPSLMPGLMPGLPGPTWRPEPIATPPWPGLP